ncbi:MAG TPA: rhomboid family intramembrane serine protease [Thermoanaerobaculia bacterium]|jgi:membrane associated rhomboid family serine protease
MFRSKGENLRAIYILLFLNIAFFLLQHQDPQKFASLFAFDWHLFARGEFWRAFTYQFVQAGHVGLITIPPVLTLFLNLVLLTLMGLSVEEDWGTFHFLSFYLISTLTTAAVAAYLNTPLLGSFFINFTLLFVYASLNRDQTFYLSMLLPIRITLLAWIALAALVAGVFFGGRANLAALIGAAAGYAYYLSQRVRVVTVIPPGYAPTSTEEKSITTVTRNLARVAAVKKALSTASENDIDRLIAISERDSVRGVNICPPVDYKPEHSDRYCVRCEGFAECTARHLRLNRPKRVDATSEVVTET